MKRIGRILWPVFFLLLTGVFFYQTFTRGNLPVPADALVGLYHPWRDLYGGEFPRGVPFKNFLITDPIRQQIPWRKLAIDTWKSGRSPGWNPYTFAGVPLNANIQGAPFYPLNILFFLFRFPVAWATLIFLEPLLAGLFLFWYLRSQKLTPGASVIGAIAWAFGGFSIAWMTWGTIVHTALWVPLTLLAIDHLLERKTRMMIRWAIVLTLSIVMTITAGHAQVALYMSLLAGFYIWWRMKSGKGSTTGLRWIGVAIGVSIVLTAIQWIPFLRFLPQTGRVGALDSWKTAGWFLPWQNLAQFVAPDFFGNPATLNYSGVWNYGEFIGYIGIIPLVLALSAVFLSGVPLFFSVALSAVLLLMLPSPVSSVPFLLHLPIFSVLQPTRLMAVVDLCLAVLAAYGFNELEKNSKRITRAACFVGLILVGGWTVAFVFHLPVSLHNLILPTLLFVLGLIWYRWRRMGSMVVIVLIIFDLFRFGWKFTPFTAVSYFYPETKVLRYIQSQPGQFRVMSLDDRILPPNTTAYYGIESIEGYDPIAPLRYENFLAASELGKSDLSRPSGFNRIYTAHNIDSALLPYLNVRYVLTLSDLTRPFLRKVLEDGEVRLYEYTKSLPRVYVAERILVEKKSDDILNNLMSMSGSPVGIVEQPIEILSVPISAGEGVHIMKYSPNMMDLGTTTVNPRLIVVLNAYDPGWSATIDGKPTPVMRVNYLFTGLVVPSGTHNVKLVYR